MSSPAKAKAVLVHGTLVSTWSLIVAAQSFDQISGPLRALALIDLRSRHGTLAYRYPVNLHGGEPPEREEQLDDQLVQIHLKRATLVEIHPKRATLDDLPHELTSLVRSALVDQLDLVGPARRILRELSCRQSHVCGCGECFTKPSLVGLDITLPRCDGCLMLVGRLLGSGEVPVQYLASIVQSPLPP